MYNKLMKKLFAMILGDHKTFWGWFKPSKEPPQPIFFLQYSGGYHLRISGQISVKTNKIHHFAGWRPYFVC